MSVSSLAFPYTQADASALSLNRLFITNDDDSWRYTIEMARAQPSQQPQQPQRPQRPQSPQRPLRPQSLQPPQSPQPPQPLQPALSHATPTNPVCTSIIKAPTDCPDAREPVPYMQDTHLGQLLVSVPGEFHRLKLNVAIEQLKLPDYAADHSLVIAKVMSRHMGPDAGALEQALNLRTTPSHIEISRLPYRSLPFNEQRFIVNDLLQNDDFSQGGELWVSLWQADADQTHRFLFGFRLWMQAGLAPLQKTSTGAAAPAAEALNLDPSVLNVANIRRAFTFNIEDGPELRLLLQKYERDLPSFRRHANALVDELRRLDSSLSKIIASKLRLYDSLCGVVDLQAFHPLLAQLGFKRDAKHHIHAVFDHFEKDLRFFLGNVCDYRLLLKVLSNFGPAEGTATAGAASAPEGAASGAAGTSPLEVARKLFESSSKEYYAWLNKYLSNEKERPALKLLAKRKVFELSKFDYLNYLNLLTNNQYFNQFLHNMFKLATRRHPGQLAFKYELYLNLVSRFNSEKLLLRQSIEACRTNDELSLVLKHNLLNLKEATDTLPVTSLGDIDLIFAGDLQGDDQNSEMASILYTLGGQGKQGWHKEWVVLSRGQLTEYSDWRKGRVQINTPIEIALANVRPTTHDKRKHCFEIMTSRGTKHVFQAINEAQRDNWIRALYNSAQMVDTARLELPKPDPHASRDKKKLLHLNVDHYIPHRAKTVLSPQTVTQSPLPAGTDYVQLVRADPARLNDVCSDCGLTDAVEWVSLNFLTAFCVKCSSGHRHLGSHVSRIKSLKLDHFKGEIELLLKYVNNSDSRTYLEARLPSASKLAATCSDEDRMEFIRKKYLHKNYVRQFASQDELDKLLIKSVQLVDIAQTVQYIVCGANVNTVLTLNVNKLDTIQVTLLEYSLRKATVVSTVPPKTLFVITEILVLNGCKADKAVRKELGLAPEAIEYWRSRLSKLLGM
jgi:Arf-GAP/SH3 domain/ANK repeat/PH domain-containing protein